jgi:sec-independent protein translocase protein TatC
VAAALNAERFIEPVVVREEDRLPFTFHLEELRRRILRSLLWVALGAGVSFQFAPRILSWLLQPVGKVVFLSPAEPFLLHLKAAFLGGVFLGAPLIAWEIWGFLSPALRFHERRVAFFLVPVSVGLFFLGGWFGWRWLLPAALSFLLTFQSERLTPMLTAGSTIPFLGGLVLGSGIAFQVPVVVGALARFGVVGPVHLLRQWRLAILAILIFSAVITPTPDIATQLLLAIPIGVLYLGSVGVASLVRKGDPLRAD